MQFTDLFTGLLETNFVMPSAVSEFVIDSRQATDRSVFFALPGENTDGHAFVGDAIANGAQVAVVHEAVGDLPVVTAETEALPESPFCVKIDNTLQALQGLATYWRNHFNPRVIGITGSVGKTSTKEVTAAVLRRRYHLLKSQGNYNNEIGLPLTLLNLNAEHECLVLEMGMYDLGEITLLCKIARPQVGVITNVGPVHLERLGTVERIAQAKAELVKALPADGVAVLNLDDPLVQPMREKTSARVMTYGLDPQADLWASGVTSAGLEGIRFAFHHGNETIHASLPLLGRHSVHTALRAASVGLVEGLGWDEIIAGLQNLSSSAQLRLVSVPGPNGSILLDDTYNASPASTIAALNLLDDLPAKRHIAVLGDMMELGSYEEIGHRKVGCRAADVVDLLITIGPRATMIADEARHCGLDRMATLQLHDNQAVIDYLREILQADDVVLVKGSFSRRMDRIISELTVRAWKQTN